MKDLNVVIGGKFHYFNYLPYLERRQALNQVFYSHKLGKCIDLPGSRTTNLFLKEYALGLHIKLLGEHLLTDLLPLYHLIWEAQLAATFKPASLNLFLLHGNCLGAIKRAKAEGCVVIGEVVNAHPQFVMSRLKAEALVTGSVARFSKSIEDKIEVEAGLVDYLLCPSEFVAESYVSRGFCARRTKVIPYGLSVKESGRQAAVHPRLSNEANILYVGQIVPRKGIRYLLRALKLLDFRYGKCEIKLTLVGRADPSYMNYLNGITPNFSHIPYLPNGNVLKMMAAADVVVLPSIEDGFGMVVAEALSVFTPVLVSKYAGAAEIVQRYGGGLVVDPADTQAFAAGVHALLSKNFPSRSSGAYTWSDYCDELCKWFGEIQESRE